MRSRDNAATRKSLEHRIMILVCEYCTYLPSRMTGDLLRLFGKIKKHWQMCDLAVGA
jgi:hypothetical protein